MAEVFANAVRKVVLFRAGNFVGSQRPRFVKAPFEVVVINGVTFVEWPVHMRHDSALLQLASGDDETKRLWRSDFAYLDLEPIILEEHQMGDKSDTWYGLHGFGRL